MIFVMIKSVFIQNLLFKNMKVSNMVNFILIAIAVIYTISPDAIPSPIDDAIVDLIVAVIIKIKDDFF